MTTPRSRPTPLHVVVADNVRILCSRRHVRQSDVATALGMSRMAVSDRFGYRVPWTLDDVQRLAAAFQVPLGVIFGEAPMVDACASRADAPPLLGIAERAARLPSLGQLLVS